MILRRLIQHVKDQNWFAVGLEFVIVIAGVVVGFQVTEFANAARERAEEDQTLARLRLESEAVVDFWAQLVEEVIGHDRERIILLRALQQGRVEPGDEAAVYSGIERLFFYPAISPPSTVFEELLASGGLRRISDSAANAAVAEYASTLSFITGQLTQFRTSTPGGIERMRDWIYSRYDPTSSTLRRYEYDFEALAADRDFISSVVDASRNQRVFLFFRMGALNRAIEMCAALSLAEGVACQTAESGRAQLAAARTYIDEMREPAP